MKKLFLLPVILLINFVSCYAIDSYEKGFIVTLDYDTIYGSVEFPGESAIRKGFNFKDEQNNVTFYYPSNLLSFTLNDGSSFKSVRYSYTDGGEKMTEKNLARVILVADYNLYKLQLSTSQSNYVYIVQREDDYFTIFPELNIAEQPTGKISQKSVGVLIYLLNLCSEVETKNIVKTSFEDSAMIDLLSKCSIHTVPVIQQQSISYTTSSIFKLSINAGYNYLYYYDNDNSYIQTTGQNISLSGYFIGLSCEISNNRLSKNSSAILGLNFFQYKKDKNIDIDWGLKFNALYDLHLYNNKNSKIDFLGGVGVSYFNSPEVTLDGEIGVSYRFKNIGITSTFQKPFLAQLFIVNANVSYYF